MVAAIDMEETMISATTRRNLRLQAKEEGRSSCDPEALASALCKKTFCCMAECNNNNKATDERCWIFFKPPSIKWLRPMHCFSRRKLYLWSIYMQLT